MKYITIFGLVMLMSCHNGKSTKIVADNACQTDTIPFTMVDTVPSGVALTLENLGSFNRIIVEVGINDTVLRALLDCGYPHSAFNRKVLEKINQSFTVFNKDNELSTTDMTLLLNHTSVHLDTIHAVRNYKRESYCDAILGVELFERHIVELDFEHRNIIIHRVLPDKVTSYKTYDLYRVPEDTTFGMLPRVIFDGFVKTDGSRTDAWLLVDLGAVVSIWHKDFRMQLTTDSLKQDTASKAYDLLRKTNQLNDYFIPIITDDNTVKEDGYLGVDYLSQHSVIFDYPHNRLYLKPNNQ
ncbi:MAG: hypothetical protein K6D59_00010 [Bacteroidales bacterium]|nr:hypothetical protein [Bacteroidales bacterium]